MNVLHDSSKAPLCACHSISVVPTTFDFHFHDTYEIFFFLSGRGEMFVNQKKYSLHPGSLLFMNTNEIHRVFPDFSVPYERMVVNFNPALIHALPLTYYNPLACFQNRNMDECNITVLSHEPFKKCYKLISDMINCLRGDSPDDELLALSYLMQLLVLANKVFASSVTDAMPFPELIEKAIHYINGNISAPLTLESISGALNVDSFYLGHEFKRHTGTSPYHYILTKRIALAKEALAGGANGIQACDYSGFGDYSNFCRVFKKYVSLSPTQYRSTLHNKN